MTKSSHNFDWVSITKALVHTGQSAVSLISRCPVKRLFITVKSFRGRQNSFSASCRYPVHPNECLTEENETKHEYSLASIVKDEGSQAPSRLVDGKQLQSHFIQRPQFPVKRTRASPTNKSSAGLGNKIALKNAWLRP